MVVLGKRVYAKRVLDADKIGSFVLAGACRDMNPLYEVKAVGDVLGVSVGDKIVCDRYSGEEVGENEYIFKEEHILCVVEDG